MDKAYFKQYYRLEREHWWFKARIQILAAVLQKNLPTNTPLKILNVGVATGATSEMLQQFGEVTSIEYDQDCCNFMNQQNNLQIQQGSITALNFNNHSFDVVCSFDVIEHVEDDATAAKELERVCAPNGFIFVTTPAYQFLWSEHDVVNHHFRRYTRTNFSKLFNTELLTPIKKTYFNFFLFPPIALIRIVLWPFQKNKTATQQSQETDATRFSPGILNNLLYQIFLFEKALINTISFPFGVSIMLLFKKKK
jgi:2-polyprenyl-3-methyl-5-hydroxy-6-metoxy-1,4-benzoquinol methylase